MAGRSRVWVRQVKGFGCGRSKVWGWQVKGLCVAGLGFGCGRSMALGVAGQRFGRGGRSRFWVWQVKGFSTCHVWQVNLPRAAGLTCHVWRVPSATRGRSTATRRCLPRVAGRPFATRRSTCHVWRVPSATRGRSTCHVWRVPSATRGRSTATCGGSHLPRVEVINPAFFLLSNCSFFWRGLDNYVFF